MSTNYTGSRTATQAPASPPDSASPPLVVLPADGDPLTAASVAQAFKHLADQVAWERLPSADGGIGSGRPVKVYSSARGLNRFIVDHQGFPAGKFIHWQESWGDVGMVQKNTISNGSWAGRWVYSIDGAAAGTLAVGDAPYASLITPGSGGSAGSVHVETRGFPIAIDADTAVSLQWDFSPALITANVPEIAMGISTVRQTGAATLWTTAAQPGAAIVYRSTAAGSSTNDTNFQCYTNNVGGTPAYNTTGLAPGATSKFRARIDIYGANASDDSTARVLFWLMGSLKANVSIDISNGTPNILAMPFFRIAAVATPQQLRIHPTDLRAVTWPGGIAF